MRIMEEVCKPGFEAIDSGSVIQSCCSVPASSEVFKAVNVVHNLTAYPNITVQPVPAPVSTKAELSNSKRLTGNR